MAFTAGFLVGLACAYLSLCVWVLYVDWHTRRAQRRAWHWDRRRA